MSTDELIATMETANLDGLSVRDLWRLHTAARELSKAAVKTWAVEAKKTRSNR